MNDLRDLVLLVLALFSSMTALLYVLTMIDPQTVRPAQGRPQPARVRADR